MDQPEKRSSISAKRSVARLPLSVIALGVVSLFNDSAGDMINPLLPAFVASVGGGPEALGLIEGIADAIASILQLGSGYLADRLGRLKAVTMVGYAIAAISRPLLAFAVAPWQILITRFGDRVGKGIRGAPRDRLIADAASPEIRGRSFGFHRAMDNAGALVGSLVVYVLLGVGTKTRTIFLWTAVPGLLSLTILGGAVREVKAPSSPSRIEVGVPDSPKFRRFLVALFVFTLGSASDSFLLWRAREVGIPMLYAPLLLLILASVKVASSIPGGELSDRLGRRKTIVAGWILYGCVYLGFAFCVDSLADMGALRRLRPFLWPYRRC